MWGGEQEPLVFGENNSGDEIPESDEESEGNCRSDIVGDLEGSSVIRDYLINRSK
jgi:hypothetical protein